MVANMDNESASAQFDRLVRAKVESSQLEELQDRLYAELEQQEYNIAEQVAINGETAIGLGDVVGFLGVRIRWEMAAFGDRSGSRHRLLADLSQSRLSPEALNHLDFVIDNTKKSVLIGRKFQARNSIRDTQRQWFGIDDRDNSPVGRAVENVTGDMANNAVWEPYLVKGLEHGYKLMRSRLKKGRNNASLVRRCTTQLEGFIQDDQKPIEAFDADYLDISELLVDRLGNLGEIDDQNTLQSLGQSITSWTGSELQGNSFQVLRGWSNDNDINVVEGRYVKNNESQLAASEFKIFTLRNSE